MKLIKKDRLGELLAAIAESEALYLPVDRDDGNAEYRRYEEGTELSSKLNTVRSAKDFFFPQTENLVDFKLSGNNIEVIDPRRECEDFVIFGVRACDAASFSVLDRVFIETPPEDTFYKNRREHATIVTLACSRPAATCFCHTFGIDMTEPKGGDITAWELEDGYAFRAETEKGSALLARLDSLLTDDASAEGEIAEQREQTKARAEKLPLSSLTTEKFDGRDMLTTFRDSRWDIALRGMPRLRNLYVRLPDLPVLRHQGIQDERRRKAFQMLGFLHVFGLYKDGWRSAASYAARAFSSALYA